MTHPSVWRIPFFSEARGLFPNKHYIDVIMTTMASQITSLTVVYSIVYSDADQRKHQSSASLAFVRGIHREPVNSPHKWPVTRKMFPFNDVIMLCGGWLESPCSGASVTSYEVTMTMHGSDVVYHRDQSTRCLLMLYNKENIKAPHHWPFVRESIGER